MNAITRMLCAGFLIGCAWGKPTELVRISTVSTAGMPKNIVQPGSEWNFGPGSLWTHKGWQYAAFWDEACQVSVARRKLPEGTWEVMSLPGYQRTATGDRGKGGVKSRGFGDGHEKVAMGISPDGVIHLSFDHHLSTLRYRHTLLPVAENPAAHTWSPDLFGPVQDNLGGPKIESVTYPSFTTDGTHFVLYLRLNGGSGAADSNFFEYEGGKWIINDEASAKLIDKRWSGGDKTVNAYAHGLVIKNERRYLTWCWRDTPDSKTCHDLCFAYSDDQGATWKNNSGEEVGKRGEIFMTADTPGIAAVRIPAGSGYLNGGSLAVDDAGRIHVLVRGKGGRPVHYQRNPGSTAWQRHETNELGKLIVGPDDALYVVADDGIYRTSAERFGKLEPIVSGKEQYFDDSKMGVDRSRIEYDGWISVIGQRNKEITVLDYWIGK